MEKTRMFTILVLVLGLLGSTRAELPLGWRSADVGDPWPPGTTSYDETTGQWTVVSDGYTIWDRSDEFHFIYKPLRGDGHIIARVVDMNCPPLFPDPGPWVAPGNQVIASVPGPDPLPPLFRLHEWAKAGVMIREDLVGPSKHATMVMTPTAAHGAVFQWRESTGGDSATSWESEDALPYWVKVERIGDTFRGFISGDGTTWEPRGAQTIPMSEDVYIGLAVSSQRPGGLTTYCACQAKFDNVTVKGEIGMGTAFSYQGQLADANAAANGLYDFEYKLYDAPSAGNQLGDVVLVNDLDVIEGYFTVELDFGQSVFDGNDIWLEIGVRPGDSTGSFTTLDPRQEILPAPYAVYANNAVYAKTVRVPLKLSSSRSDYTMEITNWGTGSAIKGVSSGGYAGYFQGPKSYFSGQVGIGAKDPDPSYKLHIKDGHLGLSGTRDNAKILKKGGGLTIATTGSAGGDIILQPHAGRQVSIGVAESPTDLVVTDDLDVIGDIGAGRISGQELDVAGHINTNASYRVNRKTVLLVSPPSSTFVGLDAGKNSTGVANVAVGNNALYNNTTGERNSAVGSDALFKNTTGIGNSGLGDEALRLNTTGSENTAVGRRALSQHVSGTWNTALGSDAGGTNQAGNNNVFLGQRAGYYEKGSDKLYIGSGFGREQRPLIYGDFNSFKLGIDTTKPQYTLDVFGSIRATGSVYYGGSEGSAAEGAYEKPDYVFEEGYDVMSTEQVEDYLEKENHLPWMTSVKQEKKENGDVIDMTRMAFETVETAENLQLQLIALNKLIKEQTSLIKGQQKRIAALEETVRQNELLGKKVEALESMIQQQKLAVAKEVQE